MTQLESARQGIVTAAMKTVAAEENVAEETVRAAVAAGTAVIPLNPSHANCRPVGVGRMFTTKINANLGRSVTHSGKGDELEKLAIALKAGADFVMDLSVGEDVKAIRQGMFDASPKPLGTVPVYETISRLKGDIPHMYPSLLLDVSRELVEEAMVELVFGGKVFTEVLDGEEIVQLWRFRRAEQGCPDPSAPVRRRDREIVQIDILLD